LGTPRFDGLTVIQGDRLRVGTNLSLGLAPVGQTSTFWPPVLFPDCIGMFADGLFAVLKHRRGSSCLLRNNVLNNQGPGSTRGSIEMQPSFIETVIDRILLLLFLAPGNTESDLPRYAGKYKQPR
jgi:hypothetical protein